MASKIKNQNFYDSMKPFPLVINGRINTIEFLEASMSLVQLIELHGKLFAPVKYDVLGNIEKIKKCYQYDENSCLLELMLQIGNKDATGPEALLWLNRALLFMEIFLDELIATLQAKDYDVSMKKILVVAYEGSMKKHHNWVTQQIFHLICKMCGSLAQYLKTVNAGGGDLTAFVSTLTTYNIQQHLVRCKIDDFFKEHHFFDETL